MSPQKVFCNFSNTMSGGLAPYETGLEYMDYSTIYGSIPKVTGLYRNSISRKDVTDKDNYVLCHENRMFELKRIIRKAKDNHVLMSISNQFHLKSYRTSGYTEDICLLYKLVNTGIVCISNDYINFYGLTPRQVLKKGGVNMDKYKIHSINLTINDAYFSIDVGVRYDEPINTNIGDSTTLRIYVV
jgi:hypothetical protein